MMKSKKMNKHEYDALYSEVRKQVERLLFEPKDEPLFINGFSQLEELAMAGHEGVSQNVFHNLFCEVYNDLFREGLIVVDPMRGFHIFTVSSRCVRRYRKRHVRPRQSAQ